MPAGKRITGYTQLTDIVPTLIELAQIECLDKFDGSSLVPLANGDEITHKSEFYFTECTWMRKHGWRTPEWKLIVALEPDFHYKPPVELYNLVADPLENNNLADSEPELLQFLKSRLDSWIAKREAETGNPAPIYNQPDWHGHEGIDYFTIFRTGIRNAAYRNAESRPKLAGKARRSRREGIDENGTQNWPCGSWRDWQCACGKLQERMSLAI